MFKTSGCFRIADEDNDGLQFVHGEFVIQRDGCLPLAPRDVFSAVVKPIRTNFSEFFAQNIGCLLKSHKTEYSKRGRSVPPMVINDECKKKDEA